VSTRSIVSRRHSAPGPVFWLQRHVRLVADLGLLLGPILAVETVTGGVLFLFAHALTPKGSAAAALIFDALVSAQLLFLQDVTFHTDLHVWVGDVSTVVIVAKALASWPTLTTWWPGRFTPARLTAEKAMAWMLLVLAPTSYVTGLALTLRPYVVLPFSHDLWREAHLWSSALLIVPLAWHVWRFTPTALRVLSVQLWGSRASRLVKPRRSRRERYY
jgi:hypothetical protein